MASRATNLLAWRSPSAAIPKRLPPQLLPELIPGPTEKTDSLRLTPQQPRQQPTKPRKPRRVRKPPASLSDEQLLALLGIAQADCPRNWVLILLAYWNGLRASEAVNLRENDFDLVAGTVQITRGKGSEGGLHELQEHENPLMNELAAVTWWLQNRAQFGVKGAAKRQLSAISSQPSAKARKMQQSTQIVTFSPEPASILGEKPAGGTNSLPEALTLACGQPVSGKGHSGDDLLFPISRTQFWRIVHGYALAAGIPRRKCKTHMLKHTIAKHLVRAGVPLNEVQEWMGWSSIETMNWYTRADEEELSHRIGNAIRMKVGLRSVRQGNLFSS
jgi:site-specific recombinase XerD